MKINANNLFSERGKFDHTRTAKRALAVYAKYVCFQDLKSVSLLLYTHSRTCAVVQFGNVWCNGNCAQVLTDYTSRSLCMYVDGNTDDIQHAGTWSAAAPRYTFCVIAKHHSSRTLVSLLFYSRKEKIRHAVLKYYFIFYFLKTAESKFGVSRGVSI